MGSSHPPKGPSLEERRTLVKSHWETFQKWGQDATKGFEAKTASAKAQMAASGTKAGSQQWNVNLASLQSDYEKEIEGIKTGATAEILEEWAAGEQERTYQESERAGRVESNRLNAEYIPGTRAPDLGAMDYLKQEFGALESEGESEEQKAARTAKTGGGGSRAAVAEPTATVSPWW